MDGLFGKAANTAGNVVNAAGGTTTPVNTTNDAIGDYVLPGSGDPTPEDNSTIALGYASNTTSASTPASPTNPLSQAELTERSNAAGFPVNVYQQKQFIQNNNGTFQWNQLMQIYEKTG